MKLDRDIRDHVARALAWGDAHVTFEQAVEGIPPENRGRVAAGLPHTLWELVEHLRITQADILAFCRQAPYLELSWPRDYWPPEPTPPSDAAWERSISLFLQDRRELIDLAGDESVDLLDIVAHGTDQTYLRELLLVIDHSSYHVGQIVLVRSGLGIWGS